MSTIWTRDSISHRILEGDVLIIYHDNLIRIPPSWLDAHPGGTTALLHFAGRDATDEIEAFHPDETLKLMTRYYIGRVQLSDAGWEPLVPPIMSGWVRAFDAAGKPRWHREAVAFRSSVDTDISPSSQILLFQTEQNANLQQSVPDISALRLPPTSLSPVVQARHSKAYKELHARIAAAGLYKTPYLTGYGPELARYMLLALISAYAYKHDWLVTSAVFLGLLWHQLVFIAHDLGHTGVTHNWEIDRLLCILVADLIGGLSIGWWVENHNVHHLVTNHPSHDPDIEHLPFFAISTMFFQSLWSSYYKKVLHFDKFANFFISIQHRLFYFVMLFARFNLYANSYIFLFKKASDTRRARGGRWAWSLEIASLILFWCWFGRVLYGCGSWQKALVYLLVSHVVTSPLHIQIVLSHFSMSTADLGPVESFPARQLRTTSDVFCPESIEFIHGGLHLQVTHHLFPRLPRHNLRRASEFVKEFAKEQRLKYSEFGFVKGNQEVLGVLKSVADQVKFIGKVAKAEAQEMSDKKFTIAHQNFKY